MTRTLPLRSLPRSPHLLVPAARRAPALPCAPTPWCCPRRSSTLSPTTIASLLRPPPPPSSPPQQAVAAGETLTLNGFVQTVRKQKRRAFVAISDGSSLHTVQAVLTPQQAIGLSTGVAVSITGQWTPSPGHEQSHEMRADSVRILGDNCAMTNPLQKKYQTNEFLRTLPHLRARLPFNALLLRLRSKVIAQLSNYLSTRDFVQVHPPIITSSDCEGAGEVFTVAPASSSSLDQVTPEEKSAQEGHFFHSPKYLTVSSQLHLEALAQSVGRVWTLSPTFRAERSDTPRHLSEFYMLEVEQAFVEDVSGIMDVAEEMLRAIALDLRSSRVGQELLDAAKVRQHEQDETTVDHIALAQRWQGLLDGPWPRITYNDAIQYLKDAVTQDGAQFNFAPSHRDGLQTEHERYLAESIGHRGPVFVTNYPRDIKPFYMAPSAETATDTGGNPTVACFDLLVPDICELVGGSMREHRLDMLEKSMDEHGLQRPASASLEAGPSEGSLEWYLDLRRYGAVPHGGFGLGFDRLLCYLSGTTNIRDVVSFPRWHRRCDC